LSDIHGLLCQEKIAKEELDHVLHCQYLFLSRGISKLVNDNKILFMASPQGYLSLSHFLYGDDIFVLCREKK